MITLVIANILVLRPVTRAMAAESRRVAELLSLLPEEVDTEKLITNSGYIEVRSWV